jgi:prepilin-type N-terminal cleavage/methylation domain-containing protein
MKTNWNPRRNSREKAQEAQNKAAFSLVEMMVAVAILGMMIVGLLAMFSQVSKALRGANNQTDVMESGRMMSEMITREVQQAAACSVDGGINFLGSRIMGANPLNQFLPGGGRYDNDLEALFFLTRENTEWRAIGYFVDPAANGVGTLYRFYAATNSLVGATSFYRSFTNEIARLPNSDIMRRVAAGVVQLEVHVYDANGADVTNNPPLVTHSANVAVFTSNALPAFVEVKLGVLEAHLVDRLRNMPPDVARPYLEDERRTAQTHLFRQRIPIYAAANQ